MRKLMRGDSMPNSTRKIRWRTIFNGALLSFILISFFQNCAPPQKVDALALDKEFEMEE
jgi:hypothetical protein